MCGLSFEWYLSTIPNPILFSLGLQWDAVLKGEGCPACVWCKKNHTNFNNGCFMCHVRMSSWGHAQAGLSVSLREASEAGGAGWLSLPCDGLQHARLPCPSLSPRVCSNSCPWSRWCHPTISSSVAPFSFCLQSFPASWSFPMSWLFSSGGRSIGTSASVLPVNVPGWFPSGLTGLISLPSKDLLRVYSSITILKHQVSSFPHSFFSVFCLFFPLYCFGTYTLYFCSFDAWRLYEV